MAIATFSLALIVPASMPTVYSLSGLMPTGAYDTSRSAAWMHSHAAESSAVLLVLRSSPVAFHSVKDAGQPASLLGQPTQHLEP